ncbi:MAG: C40 family peptidase [Jejuia sp.]
MKKYLILCIIILGINSCKSSKRPKVVTKKSKVENVATKSEAPKDSNFEVKPSELSTSSKIINYSKQFLGTRYKWGGTTKRGMDCSGLVFESFRAHNIYLPRISRDMAKKGEKIELKNVVKGDLLFFKTGKNRRNAINHVGLVIDIKNNAISFIHATTSKGVIISSLNDSYWKSAFIEARKVL